MKITSADALDGIRRKAAKALSVREASKRSGSVAPCGLELGTPHIQILCCGGTGCKASESAKIVENFHAAIQAHGITDKVDVIVTGCFGFCEKGPIVKIVPDNTFYTSVRPADVEEIVSSHIIAGNRVERLLYLDPGNGRRINDSKHMNFYRKQMRVALRNCGVINPEDITEYIARHGYQALARSLKRNSQDVLVLARNRRDGGAAVMVVNLNSEPITSLRLRAPGAAEVSILSSGGTWESRNFSRDGEWIDIPVPIAFYEAKVFRILSAGVEPAPSPLRVALTVGRARN